MAATGLVISLKLDSYRQSFNLCDLEIILSMTSKTIGHLFYTIPSSVHHFKSMGEFKLESRSRNCQFWRFFVLYDLEIWQMTLKNIGLRATIDHHGPSIHSGHYTASINCCKNSTAYCIWYELIDTWFLDSNRRVGVWSLPWRWHILSIPLTTGRGTSAETCGLDVFPPDDLGSRPEALC